MSNQLQTDSPTGVAKTQQQLTKQFFSQDNVRKKFEELLGKKAQGFVTSVLQCVSSNAHLVNAETNSIYQAAMMAATLDLPINNNLGFAYIIPYTQSYKDDKGIWQKKQVAQFQLGYKGFIQLAQRSGQFKTISATPIYAGQIVRNNPLTGIEFDFSVTAEGEPVGYAAYFSLLNGFEKTLYMTTEEVKKHGVKYSKSFSTGVWTSDFPSMAIKTVTKLLLSKFAPLSIEMQKAVTVDQSVINNAETEDITYIDTTEPQDQTDKEVERMYLLISDATSKKELESLRPDVPEQLLDLFNQKITEVK
ncbi:recombinase RecT [Pedobacter sp. SYSU D00535]|uniref:recombinase RecT n=1 Tax=Pedobacter sp. SYSU D00535 TaxID=2810308 RepID=UPI001A97655E|nr:recombinase RecT [Pedobacter sp. SYSU D00535]